MLCFMNIVIVEAVTYLLIRKNIDVVMATLMTIKRKISSGKLKFQAYL